MKEYIRARTIHKPMHSYHEGYAIMKEEFEEFWDEIKKKHPSKHKIEEELIQIAAMCMAFYAELIEE